MSSRKGESTRKRPQKYQNARAYKNNLYDGTPLTKALNSLYVAEVCEKCKRLLDWKIKYKKFKPRKYPGTCNKCCERNVKHAYHTMCKGCSDKLGVCPKCGTVGEVVVPIPTPQEQLRSEQEMQSVLKTLSERKRRTFLRYLDKTRKQKKERTESFEEDDIDSSSGACKEKEKIEGTKDATADLMAFLQQLKLSDKKVDHFDDLDDLCGSDSEDGGFDTDDSDEEEDADSSESDVGGNKK